MVKSAARIVMFGACALCVTQGWTQGYPSKPIRLIVPNVPGGGTDTMGK